MTRVRTSKGKECMEVLTVELMELWWLVVGVFCAGIEKNEIEAGGRRTAKLSGRRAKDGLGEQLGVPFIVGVGRAVPTLACLPLIVVLWTCSHLQAS